MGGQRERERKGEGESQRRTSFRDPIESCSRCQATAQSGAHGGKFEIYAADILASAELLSCATATVISPRNWSSPYPQWDPRYKRKPNPNRQNPLNTLKIKPRFFFSIKLHLFPFFFLYFPFDYYHSYYLEQKKKIDGLNWYHRVCC